MGDLLEQLKADQKKKSKEAPKKESKKNAISDSMFNTSQKKPKRKVEKKTDTLAKESKKKIKEITRTVTKIPEEYPILILLWGADGTSKSEQILKFEPRIGTIFLCLELGKVLKLAEKLKFPIENIIVCSKQDKYNRIDGVKTLQEIRKVIREIQEEIRNGNPRNIRTVALDGITDVRPYAVAEWLTENPDRENPNTPGDWRSINDKVRDICFTLLNLGIASNINIFFTSQIRKEEGKEVPNVKEWILHVIHHKFKMTRDDINKKFYAYCEKSYFDPFFTVDLTDFSHSDIPSLMNILQSPELVETHTQLFKDGQKDLVDRKIGRIFN